MESARLRGGFLDRYFKQYGDSPCRAAVRGTRPPRRSPALCRRVCPARAPRTARSLRARRALLPPLYLGGSVHAGEHSASLGEYNASKDRVSTQSSGRVVGYLRAPLVCRRRGYLETHRARLGPGRRARTFHHDPRVLAGELVALVARALSVLRRSGVHAARARVQGVLRSVPIALANSFWCVLRSASA